MILHIHNSVINTEGMGLEELWQLSDELANAQDKLCDVIQLMEESE